MISTHLYLYKHNLNEIGIHFSKERKKKKPKHLKLSYLLNYLNKMKLKIKQLEDVII
jgi:hypothetical protein